MTDKTKEAPKMNTEPVVKSITAAREAVKTLIDEEIKARRFNGLRHLSGVDEKLESAIEKLTKAATPREKKSRKSKKKD